MIMSSTGKQARTEEEFSRGFEFRVRRPLRVSNNEWRAYKLVFKYVYLSNQPCLTLNQDRHSEALAFLSPAPTSVLTT